MVLNGFSGSFTGFQAIIDMIAVLGAYKSNAYRISFTPTWTIGSRPYIPEYVDYLLDNWNGYVIVDRNHHTSEDVVDWVQAEASIFEVLSRWGNNPRVIIEIVNEFVWDIEGTVWDHVEPIIQRIRAEGYTNLLLINKHTYTDDWRPIGADYYGKHAYFDNLNDPNAEYNTLHGAKQYMEEAIAAGCVPLVNTEVGASYLENQAFTPDNVAALNDFLAWSQQRNIGNMIWMNRDLQNLPRYIELGLMLPEGTPITPTLNPILIAGIILALARNK